MANIQITLKQGFGQNSQIEEKRSNYYKKTNDEKTNKQTNKQTHRKLKIFNMNFTQKPEENTNTYFLFLLLNVHKKS